MWAHDIEIDESSANHADRSGFWIVEGDDAVLSDSTTNENVRIGPDHSCGDLQTNPDRGQRVRGARLTNVAASPYIEVQPGTLGAYLDTIVTPELRVGRGPGSGPDTTVPRPWDRIHWTSTGAATLTLNDLTGCRGTNIDNCVPDIFPAGGGAVPNGDGLVAIDDLLAVISGWGDCAALGACCISDVCHLNFTAAQCSAAGGTFYAGANPQGDGAFETCRLPVNNCDSNPLPPCYDPCKFPTDSCIADFLPEQRGDRSVNIDELLAVIGAWGPCPGVAPPPGGVDDIPHDLQGCMDMCDGAVDFGACMDKCLLMLCEEQGLTQYCDP